MVWHCLRHSRPCCQTTRLAHRSAASLRLVYSGRGDPDSEETRSVAATSREPEGCHALAATY